MAAPKKTQESSNLVKLVAVRFKYPANIGTEAENMVSASTRVNSKAVTAYWNKSDNMVEIHFYGGVSKVPFSNVSSFIEE